MFKPDDRVELLQGVLVDRTPQSAPHAFIIQELTAAFVKAAGDAFKVRVQLPLTVSERSEPEPDLAIIPSSVETLRSHPDTAVLVVEVSRGSIRVDRVLKAALYARAAVREYWIVDADARAVHVFRDPDVSTGSYRTTFTAAGEDTVVPLDVPAATIALRMLWP